MNLFKRIVALCCIILLFTSLFACGNGISHGNEPSANLAGTDLKGAGGSPLYNKRLISAADINLYLASASCDNHDIFMLSSSTDDVDSQFYIFNLDTEKTSEIAFTTTYPWRIETSENGNLFILDTIPVEGSQDLNYVISVINKQGELLSSLSLDHLMDSDASVITDFLPVENGIILSFTNSVVIIDYKGNLIKTFEYSGKPKSLAINCDGDAVICGTGKSGYTVEELTPDFEISKKYVLDGAYSMVYDGYLSDGIYLADQSNVYSVNYKEGTRKVIINRLANGFNSGTFICIGDSKYFSIEGGVPTIWEPKTEEETKELTVLKLATFDMDMHLREAITNFNSQNNLFFIDVIDYAIYNTGGDMSAGLAKLNTEIISGNIPDIFDLSRLPGDIYSSKGMLEDLLPYIESDPNLTYSDFVTSAMDVLSTEDNHLYDFVPAFELFTLAGGEPLSSYGDSWTPREFLDFAKENTTDEVGILSPSVTREDFMSYVLSFSGDDYINYETAEVNFNNSDFAALLEYCKSLIPKADMDYNTYITFASDELINICNGKQLLYVFGTGIPVFDYLIFDELFNNKITFPGFPSTDGTGRSLTPAMRLGMSKSSTNKDGIWEFFSFILRPEYQGHLAKNFIPIMREALVKSVNESIERYSKESAGLMIPMDGGMSSFILECGTPSENTAEQIMELINCIDSVNEYDSQVYKIVLDESDAYFTEQRNVEETVKLIQSRVQLYINEQYT